MLWIAVLISLLFLRAAVLAQTCGHQEDFKILHNGSATFTATRNGTCICNTFQGTFRGDASELLGIQNVPAFQTVVNQVATLNATVSALQAENAALRQTVTQLNATLTSTIDAAACPLLQVAGGAVSYSANSRNATVVCSTGYSIGATNPVYTCQRGAWVGNGACSAVPCAALRVANGAAAYSNGGFTATVTCSSPYLVLGVTGVYTCQSGAWVGWNQATGGCYLSTQTVTIPASPVFAFTATVPSLAFSASFTYISGLWSVCGGDQTSPGFCLGTDAAGLPGGLFPCVAGFSNCGGACPLTGAPLSALIVKTTASGTAIAVGNNGVVSTIAGQILYAGINDLIGCDSNNWGSLTMRITFF